MLTPVVHVEALLSADSMFGCRGRAASEQQKAAFKTKVEIFSMRFKTGGESVGLHKDNGATRIKCCMGDVFLTGRYEWRNQDGAITDLTQD